MGVTTNQTVELWLFGRAEDLSNPIVMAHGAGELRGSTSKLNESAPKTGALPNFNRQILTRQFLPSRLQGSFWQT